MEKVSRKDFDMDGSNAWKRAYLDANPDKRVHERFVCACNLIKRAGGIISFPDQGKVDAFFASELASTKTRAAERAERRARERKAEIL